MLYSNLLKSYLIKAILVVLLVQNVTARSAIVGGSKSTISSQKYLVQVLTGNTLCGGSLIASNWVLTAAHCVYDVNADELSIIGGSTYLDDATGGANITVSRIFVAPQYNAETQDRDAALLKLSSSMSGTNIATISRGPAVQVGWKILVSGWGRTKEDGYESKQVQNVELTVTDHTECANIYGDITSYMFCAYAPGKDSCNGDSGGPAVYDNKLVGIVSFGFGCAQEKYPGVYTSVKSIESWVQEILSTN